MSGRVCPKSIHPDIKRNPGESVEDHINRVYSVFLPLIKRVCQTATLNGKRIDIPDYGEPDKYKAFFYHLSQYDQETNVFNYKRLSLCCLLPMMIVNMCCGQCSYCIQKVSDKNDRETIFCELNSYVIVLQEKADYYLVITGFRPEDYNIKKYK